MRAKACRVDHVSRDAAVIAFDHTDLDIVVVVVKERRVDAHASVHQRRFHTEFETGNVFFGVIVTGSSVSIERTTIEATRSITRGIACIEVGVVVHCVLRNEASRNVTEALLVVVSVHARGFWDVVDTVKSADVPRTENGWTGRPCECCTDVRGNASRREITPAIGHVLRFIGVA